jgi:hypothetical protein
MHWMFSVKLLIMLLYLLSPTKECSREKRALLVFGSTNDHRRTTLFPLQYLQHPRRC